MTSWAQWKHLRNRFTDNTCRTAVLQIHLPPPANFKQFRKAKEHSTVKSNSFFYASNCYLQLIKKVFTGFHVGRGVQWYRPCHLVLPCGSHMLHTQMCIPHILEIYFMSLGNILILSIWGTKHCLCPEY